jgi:alpha-galactosidase
MTKFDDFTLSLLENDEVLALDQDALGKEATCVLNDGDLRLYEKELADGGRALGFFNLGAAPLQLDFNQFTRIGIVGQQTIRDLWRQKNVATLDTKTGSLPLTIPAHGVMLYKLTAAK